ncbi:MAG: AMIN domain-containing protein, partial [Pseudomonadota bacterium]
MKRNILGLGITALLISFATAIFAEQAITTAASQNNIRSIDVSNIQNGEVIAKLTLDQPLHTLPVGVSLNNPFRIYFDFYHVSNGLGKNIQEVAEGDLRSINIVQVGDRTRLVLNLTKLMKHDIQAKDNTLLIKLAGVAENQTVNTVVRFAEDTPNK